MVLYEKCFVRRAAKGRQVVVCGWAAASSSDLYDLDLRKEGRVLGIPTQMTVVISIEIQL
jgi:hypothetical protein